MFCHVPGLKIVSPSTPADAKGLLVSAIRDPDPVLFLEHKALYRLMKGPVPKGEYTVPIGRARVARPGSDVSVITYGLMVHHVLAAARQLASDGVDVEVLDIRTLRPLDTESVLETVRRTGKVLLVTEANPFCAVTSELGMLISEQAFDSLDAPLQRVTAPDCAGVPYASSLADAFVPSIAVIADAIRRLAAY
jgi:2-oxoisovalerate dehydrogenase E1 component beta subunit